MDKYILVISITPLKTMFSDILYNPEIKKSEKIIKITELPGNFKIEILDLNKTQDVINFNKLTLVGIEYDLTLQEIIFIVDQYPTIVGHRLKIKREVYEIRTTICDGLNRINEISLAGLNL